MQTPNNKPHDQVGYAALCQSLTSLKHGIKLGYIITVSQLGPQTLHFKTALHIFI